MFCGFERFWRGGGAFHLHYDPEDLIILQVEGAKRWRIVGPAIANPVIGMRAPPAPAETEMLFDEVLNPGDALFVPAGHWHRCEGTGPRSMHLSIFLTPPTGWHAVRAMTDIMLADELFVRAATRLPDSGGFAALHAEVKERAIARIRIWTCATSSKAGSRGGSAFSSEVSRQSAMQKFGQFPI